MTIQIRSRTATSGQASAASFGVGLNNGDGGTSGMQQALQGIARGAGQIAGNLARKEKLLNETALTEAEENWRLAKTTLANQITEASQKGEWAKVSEFYAEYETHNPSNEGWTLEDYNQTPEKRKFGEDDWKDRHNNFQIQHNTEQVDIRTKKLNAEFSSNMVGVKIGMEDTITGFYKSGVPYAEGNLRALLQVADARLEPLVAAYPKKEQDIRDALYKEKVAPFLASARKHFQAANKPTDAAKFVDEVRALIKNENTLSGGARIALDKFASEMASDIERIADANFDSRAARSRLTTAMFNSGNSFAPHREINDLAKKYPKDEGIQELAKDAEVFREYGDPIKRSGVFSQLGAGATFFTADKVAKDIRGYENLSETGKNTLTDHIIRQNNQYWGAMAAEKYDNALSVIDPILHKELSEDVGNNTLYQAALDRLDPNGSFGLKGKWHPAWEEAVSLYGKGEQYINANEVRENLEATVGTLTAETLILNSQNSLNSETSKAASGMFLEQQFGGEVAKKFKSMMEDNSPEGVQARENAEAFLKDLRDDPEYTGFVPEFMDQAEGFLDTGLTNYAKLLAYDAFRNNRTDKEGVLKEINEEIQGKVTKIPLSSSGDGSHAYVPKDYVDLADYSGLNYVKVLDRGVWNTVSAGLNLEATFTGGQQTITTGELGRRMENEMVAATVGAGFDLNALEKFQGWTQDEINQRAAASPFVAEELRKYQIISSPEKQLRQLLEDKTLIPETFAENGQVTMRYRWNQEVTGAPDDVGFLRDLSGLKKGQHPDTAPIIEVPLNDMLETVLDISYAPPSVEPEDLGIDPKGMGRYPNETYMQRFHRFWNPFY